MSPVPTFAIIDVRLAQRHALNTFVILNAREGSSTYKPRDTHEEHAHEAEDSSLSLRMTT
jgi:hypothetical protein